MDFEMYVCMYVRMYVCMYVCMYICMYVRMYVCMYVCICHVLVLGLNSIYLVTSFKITFMVPFYWRPVIADAKVSLRGELRGKAAVLVHSPSSHSASSR